MAGGDKLNPQLIGMSYNSARDELFLADHVNEVVRAIRARETAGDLRDVYRAPHDLQLFVWSVCHMSDSDTLLVCSGEIGCKEESNKDGGNWLVALSRNGSEWREAQRVHTDGIGHISCALSDSRVLIGYDGNLITSPYEYMELFRVESPWFRGKRIARVHRIHVPKKYYTFSATCGSDTLVAMSYENDNSVRLHRLRGDRLEELARIQLKNPTHLLWLADRLLVADFDSENQSHAVIELEVCDTRLERRRERHRQLIATSENINQCERFLCSERRRRNL